jgi:hypothetical protein
LSGKHLQILKEIIPGVSRVAVLGDPIINAPQFREMERVASALTTETKTLETVNGFGDLGHAFKLARAWQAAADQTFLTCFVDAASTWGAY